MNARVSAALHQLETEEKAEEAAAEEAQKLRDQCDADLEASMPPLRRALKELQNINKSDIAELKSLKNPPTGVKFVLKVPPPCLFPLWNPSPALPLSPSGPLRPFYQRLVPAGLAPSLVPPLPISPLSCPFLLQPLQQPRPSDLFLPRCLLPRGAQLESQHDGRCP